MSPSRIKRLTIISESIVEVYPTAPERWGSGPALAPCKLARPVGVRGAMATEFALDLDPPEITEPVQHHRIS